MLHRLEEYAIPKELTRKSLQFELVTKKEAYIDTLGNIAGKIKNVKY